MKKEDKNTRQIQNSRFVAGTLDCFAPALGLVLSNRPGAFFLYNKELKMTKKIKNIVLTKKKTTVEFRDVDGWIFDLRYLINGKETYSAQILQPDVAGRVARLEAEGFKNYQKQK
jgi:hypothetical protein